jgi:poly(glycerol-phosphate) alpha-glucosyltransferase
MPTIFQLTSWLSAAGGGIPPVIRALATEYRQRQMDCVVAGLADPTGALPAFPADWPVFAGRITGPAAFGYSPELARLLRGRVQKDSVIHVHGLWMYPGRLARKLSEATGAARIISPHGMLEPWAMNNSRCKKRLAAWMFENQNLRTASCLHALCQSEARSMRAYGLKNPIAIIPNGIDLPIIPNAETLKPETLKAPWDGLVEPGRKVLLYLGRIHPKKGLVNLLRAWASVSSPQVSGLRSQDSEWLLAIAGWDQGGHEAELKRLCDELGVHFADGRSQMADGGIPTSNFQLPTSNFQLPTPNSQLPTPNSQLPTPNSQLPTPNSQLPTPRPPSVVFLGPQFGEDKAACYRHCDAFILPSFSEGLPMVVLEAWAYGKPVLMTPECNLPEGFAAGAAIRIETSVDGIAQGLNELFRTPHSALRTLGDNGLRLVREQFAWPKVAAEMKSVYEWVLGGGPRPVEYLFTT